MVTYYLSDWIRDYVLLDMDNDGENYDELIVALLRQYTSIERGDCIMCFIGGTREWLWDHDMLTEKE